MIESTTQADPANVGEADDDGEKAFAEFASGSGLSPARAGEPATTDPNRDEPTAAASPAADDAAGNRETGAAEAPAEQQPASDIWSEAPEPLRAAHEAAQAELEQLRERERRARGQIGATDRRNHELQQELEALKRGKGSEETVKVDLESDDIRKLREDFPEVANPLLNIIVAQDAALNDLKAQLGQVGTTVGEQAQTAHVREQVDLLSGQHPDWRDVANSDGFHDWVSKQPTYVRQALERNKATIVDAAEAGDLIGRYKHSLGMPAPTPTPAATTVQPDERRRKQLAGGAAVQTRTPAVAAGVPEDGEAAFAYYASKGR